MKNLFLRKDPDAVKDWRRDEKETTEDELVGWHHKLNAHEFEQTPGDGEVQVSLACCSPWGLRVRHDWAIYVFYSKCLSSCQKKKKNLIFDIAAAWWISIYSLVGFLYSCTSTKLIKETFQNVVLFGKTTSFLVWFPF